MSGIPNLDGLSPRQRSRVLQRYITCSLHRRYPTWEAADRVAQAHQPRGCYKCAEFKYVVFRAYKCRVESCQQWHVGHKKMSRPG